VTDKNKHQGLADSLGWFERLVKPDLPAADDQQSARTHAKGGANEGSKITRFKFETLN
jgi:hypothetical protein